ncbi:MAG TPA: hypothetical protein VFI09_09800 [Solirubrobacterales bacterium]|nr:hypothetical protein [Solirubrobacterales bacterium]
MASACPSQGAAVCASAQVRPAPGGFEVVREGHRRGPFFAEREAAILHGEGLAPEIAVVSRRGNVELTVRSRGILEALVAEHYAALTGDVCKDRDGHWQISCRFSYGEQVGWFVEHDGYLYDGLDGEGEEGPHESREAAERCMAERSAPRDRRGARAVISRIPRSSDAPGPATQLRSILPHCSRGARGFAPSPAVRRAARRGVFRSASEADTRSERSTR